MAKPTSVTVTVNKWDDYNVRSHDYKTPRWFAQSNRILEDSDIYALSDAEFRAWIYILSQASQKKSATVTIEVQHAERVCKVNPKALFSLIEKFVVKSILSESGQEPTSVRPASGRHTTEQDITEQNNTIQNTPEVRNLTVVDCFSGNSDFERFVQEFGISSETQYSWSKLYEPEYVFREIVKAFAWIAANPRKRPKLGSGAHRFMSLWLERGFEQYRRSLPSNAASLSAGLDMDRLRRELGA